MNEQHQPDNQDLLIGRAHALHQAQDALSVYGRVLICGRAGMGSTRLCRALIAGQAAHVLWCASAQDWPHAMEALHQTLHTQEDVTVVVDRVDCLSSEQIESLVNWVTIHPKARWVFSSRHRIVGLTHVPCVTLPPLRTLHALAQSLLACANVSGAFSKGVLEGASGNPKLMQALVRVAAMCGVDEVNRWALEHTQMHGIDVEPGLALGQFFAPSWLAFMTPELEHALTCGLCFAQGFRLKDLAQVSQVSRSALNALVHHLVLDDQSSGLYTLSPWVAGFISSPTPTHWSAYARLLLQRIHDMPTQELHHGLMHAPLPAQCWLALARGWAQTSRLMPLSGIERALEQPLNEEGHADMMLAHVHALLFDGQIKRAGSILNDVHVSLSSASVVRARDLRMMIARHEASPDLALDLFEEVAVQDLTSSARLEGACAQWESGQRREAMAQMQCVLDELHAQQHWAVYAKGLSNWGVMLHHTDDVEQAHQVHQRALVFHERRGDTRFEAVACFDLAAIACERGQWLVAQSLLARAMLRFTLVADTRQIALTGALEQVVLGRLGLAHHHDSLGTSTQEDLVCAEALVWYARCHALFDALSVGGAWTSSTSDAVVSLADEVNLPLRLIARAESAVEQGKTLRFDRDLTWIAVGDSAAYPIHKRQAQRHLMRMFIDARWEAHDALHRDTLIRQIWPDVPVTSKSAKNRFHVALSALRGVGFKDLLVRSDDQYMLNPHVQLFCVP